MTEVDVLVVGGINTDYIARGEKLPAAGESRGGDTFLETLGGKGANQAVAAARLGIRVALVGATGDDARGREMVVRLRDERVHTHITAISGAATGAALIHVDGKGESQVFAVLGANQQLTAGDVETACHAVGHARVVVAQLEVPLTCVMTAFEWARRAGAITILDPAPATPLPDSIYAMLDVIRPNALEAETLTGIRVNDRHTARRAAQELLERGVGHAIVQAGSEGNVLLTRSGEHWLPHIKVATVDRTGAGDAFVGTLGAHLALGRSIADAATFANAAAARETTELGPQTPGNLASS